MIQSDFPTRQPAPKIGENGTWLEWDELTQAYVDTGRPSRGDSAGLSDDIKTALLTLAQKAAYVDEHGQDYYDALYAALYPPAELLSITASFAQGSHVVYDTDTLESLKPYLTVTGIYDDGSSRAITSYTLSGTLAEGTSTITVTASGKTTTFTVNVTHKVAQVTGISAVFTQGSAVIYDNASLDDLKPYLVVTASYDDGTSAAVSGYTLSGTLAAGTSTITVSYGGFSDTFTVTVTERPATLTSITAVFTQGQNVVYDTDSLDTLKQYIVVTANYDDSSTVLVDAANYTLSGTLTEGISTITVSYGGKTTTFVVAVTKYTPPLVYNWDFTSSLIDTEKGKEFVLSGATRDENGIHLLGTSANANVSGLALLGNTIEVVADLSKSFSSGHGRFICLDNDESTDPTKGLIYRSTGVWSYYNTAWSSVESAPTSSELTNAVFKITLQKNESGSGVGASALRVYINDVFAGKNNAFVSAENLTKLFLGATANAFYNATIKTVKVYEGVV